MSKKITIFIILLFLCFGWILGSFVQTQLNRNVSVDEKKHVPVFQDETIASTKSDGEIEYLYPEDYDIYYILSINNDMEKRVFLKNYLNKKNDQFEKTIDYIKKEKKWGDLHIVLDVWLKNDFESAKTYVLDSLGSEEIYFSEKVSQSHVGNNNLLRLMFLEWMKKNKDECINFINNACENDSSSKLADYFTTTMFDLYPNETVMFLNKYDKQGQQYIRQYYWTFSSWYKKEPHVALEFAFNLKDEYSKNSAINGIIQEMGKENPLEAIAIIKTQWAGEDADFKIYNILKNYAATNPEKALEFIRQESFAQREKDISYRAFSQALNVTDIQQLIRSPTLNLSEEEIIGIIKQKFSVGEKTGSQYEFLYKQIASSSPSFQNREDTEIALQLIDLLTEEDRIIAIRNIIDNNTLLPDDSLRFYDQLPKSEKTKDEVFKQLEKMINFQNSPVAMNYFLDHFYEQSEGQGDFQKLFGKFLDKNYNDAVMWMNELTDVSLKEQCIVAVAIKNAEFNPIDSLNMIRNVTNDSIASSAFNSLIIKVSQGDASFLADIFENAPEDWINEGLLIALKELDQISEESVDDFMNGVSGQKELYEKAKRSWVNYQSTKNLQVALEYAINYLEPGEKTNILITSLLSDFKEKEPLKAEKWCNDNGIYE